MSPTSCFFRISAGQDRAAMIDRLAMLGTVHDDLPHDQVMLIISYTKDLAAFS